jgi:hypothetical protein
VSLQKVRRIKSSLHNDTDASKLRHATVRWIEFREATAGKYWGMGPCGSFQGKAPDQDRPGQRT